MSAKSMLDKSLDGLLVEIGEMGRYQIIHYFLLNIVVILTATSYFSFVFTTGQVKYRCFVPECETNSTQEYTTEWLQWTVPFEKDDQPAACSRYQPIIRSSSHSSNNSNLVSILPNVTQPSCDSRSFDKSLLVKCEEFVFDSADDVTIITAFNLTCKENNWRLTMIGTLGFFAQMITLPICAYLSDKYGRKPILMISILMTSICGLIKSFAVNYTMFAAFEFITTLFGGGIYATLFVMAIESAGPSKRFFSGTLVCVTYAIAQPLLGFEALITRNFRHLLRVLYVPQMVLIPFVWFIPESVRWLMINNKTKELSKNLTTAAQVNGVELDAKRIGEVMAIEAESNVQVVVPNPIGQAMHSKILIKRLLICCICWFTNSMVYCGMNVHSVALGGNKYVNFILVNAVETPAILYASLYLGKSGRKNTQARYIVICIIACILVDFFSNIHVKLVLFLIGKSAITIAFTILYLFTSEIFPTTVRQMFVNACTLCSSLGSMLASQTPMLSHIWIRLPLVICTINAVIAGVVLLLPETKNTKLPDTVEEAEQLGK